MAKKVDYIIVGFGLAGACLALQLIKLGKSVMVFDQPDTNKASVVAAGLFNPITGKRIAKTWKADILFPYLKSFYKEIEENLKSKFFFPSPLYIPFRSIAEQNDWNIKSADEELAKYVESIFSTSVFGNEVKDPLGGILLSNCGHVDTKAFLTAARKKMISIESYEPQRLEDRRLSHSDAGVTYDDIQADKIIYCNGLDVKDGIYFSWLPVIPLKGEVLTVKTDKNLGRIYNRGVYILKSGDNTYKVGATYDLKNIEAGITREGRLDLESKLNQLLSVPYKTTHQEWGIRPSTRDRRLFIGEHPQFKNILTFNGLGTKGVSLAPYFSGQLADYLVGRGELDKEANISRVKSLYSKF